MTDELRKIAADAIRTLQEENESLLTKVAELQQKQNSSSLLAGCTSRKDMTT